MFQKNLSNKQGIDRTSWMLHFLTIVLMTYLAAFGSYVLLSFENGRIFSVFKESSPFMQLILKLDAIRQFSFIDVFLALFGICYLISALYLIFYKMVRYVIQFPNASKKTSQVRGITSRMFISIVLAAGVTSYLFTFCAITDLIQAMVISMILLGFGFFIGCYWEWRSLRQALIKVK